MFGKIGFTSNIGEEGGDFLPMLSMDDDEVDISDKFEQSIPLIALKNTVLFPGVVLPINIGRDKSLKSLGIAEKGNKNLIVIAQKENNTEDPQISDLYSIGVLARVLKVIKMPDGSTTAILQGRRKVEIVSFTKIDTNFEVMVNAVDEKAPEHNMEFEALISTITDKAKKIIELSPQLPSEAVVMLQNIKNQIHLLNFISSNLNVSSTVKQGLLEHNDMVQKARYILNHINADLQLLELKDQIESKVRGDIEKQQRDYFLNQQLRTIQEELGGSPQEIELVELEKRSKDKKWGKNIQEHFEKEISKAKRINPQFGEYSVIMNHLELMLDLPWNKISKDNFNLASVKKVLDHDHYGLDDVKERILEHLAVLKLKGDMKAPILCLVGPPGVGKTSLGKSIATALKRNFIRMSLGGLHDESEIRGHRKTYIGAMPGRIIKSLKKAATSNPVFILDEIDKLGMDHRGDPSSALLEVLDPEQNNAFHDNYLEIEYDLSKVLFIATANSLSSIQPALLDRMEIIEIGGYSTEEKIQIAKTHLLPKQRTEHGLTNKDISINEPELEFIIENYTRESGVRGLDRVLASVMRSIAKKKAFNEKYNKNISKTKVTEILGPPKYDSDKYAIVETPGIAIGLAWTRVGGDILFIESSISKGKGKLTLTGNLGEVMKESATTALSFIKANAAALDIDENMFDKIDIHVHVPEGAIPKDGPSAGITMLSAITSAIKNKVVKSHLAMTGEITLRGKVLPVGGIKEKVLAAKRAGIKEVMLCKENKRHIDEINQEFIKDLNFIYVENMLEVLELAIGVSKF